MTKDSQRARVYEYLQVYLLLGCEPHLGKRVVDFFRIVLRKIISAHLSVSISFYWTLHYISSFYAEWRQLQQKTSPWSWFIMLNSKQSTRDFLEDHWENLPYLQESWKSVYVLSLHKVLLYSGVFCWWEWHSAIWDEACLTFQTEKKSLLTLKSWASSHLPFQLKYARHLGWLENSGRSNFLWNIAKLQVFFSDFASQLWIGT